jgi:hypothetical protein
MRFSFMTIVLVALSGCYRPLTGDISQVSLAVPNYNELSGTPGDLSHVIINVTGPGIVEPIVQTWDSSEGSEVPSSFTVQIPNGEARLIQFLGVYKNSDEGMLFYYGDTFRAIKIDGEIIDLQVSSLSSGAAIEGHISGRYLTSADAGPTGEVKIKLFPPNKPPLLVMKEGIYNGWFNFFVLDGDATLKMGYELADGTLLWGRPVSLMDNEFQPGQNVLRAAIPLSYIQRNEGQATSWRLSSAGTRLFGWFGPGAGGKVVCRADSETTDLAALPSLSLRTVGGATAPISTASPAELPGALLVTTALPLSTQLADSVNYYAGYRIKGGLENTHSLCDSGTEEIDKMTLENLYTVQLNSDDSHSGYNFSVFKNQLSWDLKRMIPVSILMEENDFQISGDVLLGLRGSYFDRLKFYKRVGTDDWQSKDDRVPCADIARGSFGFVFSREEVLSADSFTDISLGLTAAETQPPNLVNVAVCPALGSQVLGGGFLLGPWNFLSYGDSSNFAPATLALEFFGNKVANSVCTPFFLTVQSWSGAPAVVASPLSLNFEFDDADTQFYSDQYCSIPMTSNYSLNKSSQVLYLRRNGSGASTRGLYVFTNLLEATGDLDFVDPAGTSVFLSKIAPTINAHECSTATYVSMLQNGTDLMVGSPGAYYTMALPSTPNLSYFYSSGNPCSATAPSGNVTLDNTHLLAQIDFIYRGTDPVLSLDGISVSGTPPFSGTITGAGPVPVIQPGSPQRIRVNMSQSFGAESCQPLAIVSVDAQGRRSPVPSGVVLSFTYNGNSTPIANSGFFADSNCTAVAGGPPTIGSGETQSSTYYFRWVNSESLTLGASVLAPTGLIFESYVVSVGPRALGSVVAYPATGVSFAWPSTFSGYGNPVIKGEAFQITLEARSPMGNLLTDFAESDASSSGLNLRDTYQNLSCGTISWSGGVGLVTCVYPLNPNYFGSMLAAINTGGGPSSYPSFLGESRIRITGAAEHTDTMTYLLSQDFSYTSNSCQPLLVTRGQFTGTHFVSSRVSAGSAFDSVLSAGAGVLSYHNDSTCSSGTIAQAHLDEHESATVIYAKLDNSGLAFGSLRADLVDPTREGTGLTSFSLGSPSAFSSYQLSLSKYQNYKNCAPVMIVRTDGTGAAIGAASADVATLSADFSVGWYTDSLCSNGTATVGFPIGETTGLVYMKPLDVNVGSGAISVTNGSQSGSATGIVVQP